MNKVILVGRLTDNPDVRVTNDGLKIARFRLAVDRRFKRGESDFINCVSFGKQADFSENYMSKGKKFGVIGRIQTGSYEKDGRKIYTTDVVVEENYFVEKAENVEKPNPSPEGFLELPDEELADLPFA